MLAYYAGLMTMPGLRLSDMLIRVCEAMVHDIEVAEAKASCFTLKTRVIATTSSPTAGLLTVCSRSGFQRICKAFLKACVTPEKDC